MAIINNQANVTFSYTGARAPESRNSNVSNTTLIEEYSFIATKQSLQQGFTPGENITFNINVINDGSNALTNFTISDNLGLVSGSSSPLTYILNSARLITNDTITTINPTSVNPLEFNVPVTLEVGEAFNIVYVAQVVDNLSQEVVDIVNTATINATDLTGANPVTETASNTLLRTNDADLVITKQANKSVINSNDTLDYILSISNRGVLDATDVVITDVLPEGFTINSISISQNGIVYNYNASEYTIDPASNTLTLPNASGRPIVIESYEEGIDNSAIITISGTYIEP